MSIQELARDHNPYLNTVNRKFNVMVCSKRIYELISFKYIGTYLTFQYYVFNSMS